MNPTEEKALRDLYRSWPDARLLKAATAEKHEYQPEAAAIMLQELERRGASKDEISRLAATLPPPASPALTGPQKAMSGAGDYIQRKIIGTLMIAAAFGGLIVAESVTEAISHSESYYQDHTLPRLLGALLAFGCSYAVLKCTVRLLRWTSSEDNLARAENAPSKTDYELVGATQYLPFFIALVCVVVAFVRV